MLKQKEVPTNIIDKDIRIAELEAELKKVKSRKKYGLVWEDHAEELDNKNVIPLLDLREDLSLPKINGMPDNYLIEGDNYHALKALQHTHKGKVDVIYIDPPYNTGKSNEFVYNDRIVDNNDGFRHSKWLSFMEKRLLLARNVLSDTGVIFVSIDVNEQAQLKLLMDSVFGEQNFISNMIWESKYTLSNDKNSGITMQTEDVLVYKKKDLIFKNRGLREEYVKSSYRYNDDDGRGMYRTVQLYKKKNPYSYEITSPNGTKHEYAWNYNKEGMKKLKDNNLVFWGLTGDGVPAKKVYLSDSNGRGHGNLLLGSEYGYTSTGSSAFEDIMIDKNIFHYPKPVTLIKYLISMVDNPNAVVLDFFAGSGTTAQSVLELNKEDGGNRSFIMCTNNEVSDENERNYLFEQNLIPKNNKTEYNKYRKDNPEDYDDFLNSKEYQELGIARAVTRERIKRVIEGYTTPKGVDVEGIPNNLTYLQTHEFDKIDIDGRNRDTLVEYAMNSHYINYPKDNYETVYVHSMFDIDGYNVIDSSKELVFYLNFLDSESTRNNIGEIRERFGNDVIIKRFEDYYSNER